MNHYVCWTGLNALPHISLVPHLLVLPASSISGCSMRAAPCLQVRGDAEALRADNLALAERLKFVQVCNCCKLAAQCLIEW